MIPSPHYCLPKLSAPLVYAAVIGLWALAFAPLARAVVLFEYSAELDVTSNNAWEDLQGNQNLAFTTSPANGSRTPVDVSATSDYFSNAFAFNGVSTQGASAGTGWNASVVGASALTLEMWVRPTAVPTTSRQILLEFGSSFAGLVMGLDTDGSIFSLIKDSNAHSGLPQIILDSTDQTSLITSGEFLQVTLTMNKVDPGSGMETTGTLYVNGSQVATSTVAGDLILIAEGAGLGHRYNQIGGSQRDSGAWAQNTFADYDGQIALVKISDTALSSGDVLNSYNAIAVPEPSAILLLGGSLGALAVARRRRGIRP